MTLQGKYGVDTIPSGQVGKQLERIKAGRKFTRKAAPWESWNPGTSQWLRRDLFFFIYLEGLTIEPVGKQCVISAKETDSICIADENHIEVYGSDKTYRKFETAVRKWIDFGAPRRDAYLVEVWPPSASKKRPENGWLMQRNHSHFIFRLI